MLRASTFTSNVCPPITTASRPTKSNWNWISLYGNHEDLVLAYLEQSAYSMWIEHGGYETLCSYGFNPYHPDDFDDTQLRNDTEWFRTLPLFHFDKFRAYSHAGFPAFGDWKNTNPQELYWNRRFDKFDRPFGSQYVVHGHTPHKSGPIIGTGKANIDTRAFSTGRLSIVGFNDDISGPPMQTWVATNPDENLAFKLTKGTEMTYSWMRHKYGLQE